MCIICIHLIIKYTYLIKYQCIAVDFIGNDLIIIRGQHGADCYPS